MKIKDANQLWAEYVKSNSDWREQHTNFINCQLVNANNQLKKLSKEKLIELFNIKNKQLLK